MGIFQTPARDTPQLLARCFDVDWGYCKCENFIKQPRLLDKMRRALKRYYPLIKAVFKHYAAYKDVRTGDVFNVHWPGWLQFADDIHIKGVGHVRQVTVDNVFVAADQMKLGLKLKRNVKKCLTRYEFLEAIARLSVAAFPDNHPGAAVVAFVKGYLLPYAIRDHAESFRSRHKLYAEEVDLVYRQYLDNLEVVFDTYASFETFDAAEKTMPLQQYVEVIDAANLVANEDVFRFIKYSFVYSQRTIVDEMVSDDHKRLSFLEFLEALARFADYDPPLSRQQQEEGLGHFDLPLCQRLPPVLEAVAGVASRVPPPDDVA